MSLHEVLFGDPDVNAVMSDAAFVQAMLDVEVALADAAAAAGLVPSASVDAVRAAAHATKYPSHMLAAEAADAGNVAIPLVAHLMREVAAIDESAADAVHIGATSQDILDTARVLQLRRAMPVVIDQAHRAMSAAARLARMYRDTPMAGRTWLQQSTPTTFGLKAAGWLDALARATRVLDAATLGACVLQFGGASGTLASLGASAGPVAQGLASRLDLPVPRVPWHAERIRIAELGCAIGLLIGTLGKIGRDLALLAQTEVREVSEASQPGRGSSSTMAHKHNPVASSVAIAASVRAPGLVAALLAAMPQEHERGLGGWQAEWETLPELVRLSGGASRAIADALGTLVVDPGRMRANLDALGGLTQTEAAVVELAKRVGRREARRLVDEACRRAVAGGRTLAQAMGDERRISRLLDRSTIERVLLPEEYLGQAGAFVDRVLAEWEAWTTGAKHG